MPNNPFPWQLEITETNNKVVRARVLDAAGVAIITVRQPTEEALANTRRLVMAVNATAEFSDAQLDNGVVYRAASAVHTMAGAADPTGAILLKPRILKALKKLASELPDAKLIRRK